jgi:hypothetical protein
MKFRLKKEINCLCLHNGVVFLLWVSEFINLFDEDDDCEL